MLFSWQLHHPVARNAVLLFSVAVPLFAVGYMLTYMHGRGRERFLLIAGAVLLTLGAATSLTGLQDVLLEPAHGAVTGSGNYAPRMAIDLVEAARRSAAKAMPLQHRLTRLSAEIEAGGVAAVKAASAGIGLRAGHPRAPLWSLPARQAERLAALAASS